MWGKYCRMSEPALGPPLRCHWGEGGGLFKLLENIMQTQILWWPRLGAGEAERGSKKPWTATRGIRLLYPSQAELIFVCLQYMKKEVGDLFIQGNF